MLSAWPRRGRTLLEVGCGIGLFLHALWEAGFDVTGVEHNPALLAAARDRVGDRADLHLAPCDHLPFPDRHFDYVATIGCTPTSIRLEEALRVSAKGVLVVFCNHASLAGSLNQLSDNDCIFPPHTAQATCWPLSSRLRRLAGGGRIVQRSILLGPPITWRDVWPLRFFNNAITFLPFGAWHAVRLDRSPAKGMTPLTELTHKALSPSLRPSSCVSFSKHSPL